MKQKKWWESSVDSGRLALRLKGVLLAFVPAILLIAQAKGWSVGEEGLLAVIDAIVNLVSAAGTLLGIALSIYGYIRMPKKT